MRFTTSTLHRVRVFPLDVHGQPSGPGRVLPVLSSTMTTPEGTTTMHTKLDPSDPTTLTDDEAAHLATRPTKAQVVGLLDDLRAERARTEVEHGAHTAAMMDLRTSEDGRAALAAQLDADPEARLLGELQAAVDAYEQRLRAASEANRGVNVGGYAESFGTISPSTQPERPALDSPLGRALLHLAARHGVAIEATVVFPDPQEPLLAVVPPHLAGPVRNLVERGW